MNRLQAPNPRREQLLGFAKGALALAFLLLSPTYTLASIGTTSGSVLYVDSSNNVNPKLQGDYVSFNVTNDTGSVIADAWVTIGSFTGGFVSLAPNENGIAHLGAMTAGAVKPVFFYLQVDCSSFSAGQCNVAAAQGFTVRLYSGPPTTNQLQSQSFSVTVADTISSSNNTVSTVVISSTSPTLGSIITVTVTGATGTIGAAKIFYASPETTIDFPATSFRLVATSVTFSGANTGTFANQLLVPTSAFSSTATTNYSFVATYLVVGSTTTSTPVSPVAFISSGAQVKHTNTSSFTSLSPIGVTSNSLTLSKLVNSAVWPTGGTPTYTLRVTNSSSSSTTLDDFVDTLPSSPANVTYAAGTSIFGGSAFSDPVISGSTLTWTSTFTIPANGSVDLTFQATVPNIAGSYTNSAVAHLNGTQIDTTLSTSDNSPATASLSVGSPDLTVSKTHSGNFTQGQVGATYSITVSNGGSGPSLGTVTVIDTLPVGLTATGLSGTGWTCTLGTLTCTRSDVLNSSASYPAITLAATVANNAASSVTNTATVSGGGETNTANDTSSDVTTIVQLPDLTISKTHSGNFTQGQTGATYSIVVSNAGSGPTSGTVTVLDTLPTGLTAAALSGTGWSCTLGTLTCTRSDALISSANYQTITLTVTVASNAASSITNTATVSGGGETNTGNDSSSDVTTVTQLPDLTISKTHTGNFTQGQRGATYSILVSNGGAGPTTSTVTVTDTLPTGLTSTGLSGSGWSCTLGTLTCTRSDVLNASASFPAITLTADVAGNAASSVTNSASVSGGGEANTANDTSSDLTTIVQLPDLTISKTHSGNFTQGQVDAAYSIVVSNSGTGPTTSAVTVTDNLPSGLTASAMSGSGWNCTLNTLTCTRSDVLGSSASYTPVVLIVNVATNAAALITNTASVTGGGEINTSNDTSSDVTTVIAATPTATTTSLSVLPSLSINAGTQVTLTATVTAGSSSVFPGAVDFCNTTTSQCVGLALVGTAQLQSDGTATLKLTPGAGSYNLVAFFRGTPTELASSSTPQALTIAGIGGYVTSTTISATGTSASYSLTGTVAAFGKPAPTGTISFVDTSNGNNVLGSPSLDSATLAFVSTLVPGPSSITGAPTGVVAADLNNDGKVDVVVATGATNKVSIFIGNGDGSFQTEATVNTDPVGPTVAVGVGDFNGDGKLDLAVLNSPASGPGSVSILLGNGDGTFRTQVAYETGSQPSALVVGDFNGDGNADIAVANEPDNSVGILLGNGDGSFQAPVFYAAGTAPVGLVAADLKNDGILDLITVNHSGNNVGVLIGNGDGTFAALVPYSVGNAPAAITAADFNGDGNIDVAVANQGDGTIGVLLGNGDGTFQNQSTTATSASPNFVVAGDFNGDGNADLATSDSVSGAVSFFLGKGDGTFLLPVNVSPGTIPKVLAVADANGDGLNDIVWANIGPSAALSVLLSQHIESASLSGISFTGSATHFVETSYSGDSAFAASQSSPIPLSGAGATSTTTILTASSNPATFRQAVLLTATVSPAPTGSPLGTVSFFDGATLLGTVNFNSSGIATFSDSSLSVGSHSVTAVYSGNTAFATSTSSPVTAVISAVSPASTTTTLSASPNPATAGQSVVFTATVSPAPTGNSLGTVSFFDGATLLGTASVISSGVETFSVSGLSAGSHVITAVYSGNTGFATSTSGPVTEVISPASPTLTTTALSALPNPVSSGQTVSFMATISPVPTGSPLGTVTFFDGATQLGVINVNVSGAAVFTDSGLTVGSHSITANYSGNTGFARSTSNPVTEVVSATSPTSTTTTLTASPSAAVAGQPILLTATISPAPSGSALGTVNFFDGSTLLGTGTVNASGVATFTTSNLPVGSHTLTAVYSGNSTFASSTSSPVTETVSPISTTTVLSATPNPALVGQAVLLTAAVSPSPTGAAFGAVNFFDGTTLLGSANVNASGVAIFSTTALSVGSHTLSATYSSNATFASSTSIPLTEIISASNPSSTSTTLSANPNPAVDGQSVTLTATVSPTPAGSPLGTINFFDGTTLLGTVNVSSFGVATFSTRALSAGSHSLTAVYSGNVGFAASNSSPLALTVSNAPPVYTVSAPQTPFSVTPGGSVAISISVAPTGNPFNNAVTMSATDLPPGATASFSPPTVIPGSIGTTTKMTVQMTRQPVQSVQSRIGTTLACCLVLFGLCLISGKSKDRRFLPARQTVFFFSLAAALGLMACNGGFAGKPPQPQTFVITVIGTNGSLHPSTTVTLIVE